MSKQPSTKQRNARGHNYLLFRVKGTLGTITSIRNSRTVSADAALLAASIHTQLKQLEKLLAVRIDPNG